MAHLAGDMMVAVNSLFTWTRPQSTCQGLLSFYYTVTENLATSPSSTSVQLQVSAKKLNFYNNPPVLTTGFGTEYDSHALPRRNKKGEK